MSFSPKKMGSQTDEELLPAESSVKSRVSCRGIGLALGVSSLLGVIACISYASSRHNVPVAETDDLLGLSRKNSVDWLNLGVGTACRKGAHDHTLVPEHGETKEDVGGMDKCKSMCKGKNCKGAEYRVSEDRCELWYQDIGGHEHLVLKNTVKGKPDFVCMVKQPTCTELRHHFSIFMRFVQKLNTYHDKHCHHGPSETGKCSMSYAETVDQAAHDICDALAVTCKEKNCYEEHHVKKAHGKRK